MDVQKVLTDNPRGRTGSLGVKESFVDDILESFVVADIACDAGWLARHVVERDSMH